MVAVRLLHLLVIDVGHLHLRLGRFGGGREEGDEILVFGLGLRQSRRTALFEPGVAHRQLGAHPVLRLGIGVQHGLQIQPGHIEPALLQRDHGLVEEFLIGLLRIHIGKRVGAQILVLLLFRLFIRSLSRNSGQDRNRQCQRGNLQRQPVHTTS